MDAASNRRRSDTGTPSIRPGASGWIERAGVRVHWERYGQGDPAVLLLPSWWIVHSRMWKAQVADLARRGTVVTFDGRGNGLSDRPLDPRAYDAIEFADDAAAVLDAAGVTSACVAGVSLGALYALHLGVRHPERVDAALMVGPTIPFLAPPEPERSVYSWEDPLDTDEGWAKFNKHYWLRDYEGFVRFFVEQIFPEPHSTKQVDDLVSFGLDTSADVLVASQRFSLNVADETELEGFCRALGSNRPVVVAHGTDDNIIGFARGPRLAELTGGDFVRLEGVGHGPQARHPVMFNLLLRDLLDRVATPRPRERAWIPSARRQRRALLLSSPIGLGHVWRDVAIAEELRRVVPALEVHWLAQEPVTTVLRARGETIHPASAELASEALHIDREAGEHQLHAFQALRRMDEILCANFMLFHDLVTQEQFDVWIGDEAWELDYYLHENPELKTAPFVWISDFVGFLPMPVGGEREAALTADYNAEMTGHVARYPRLRDLSIFVGDPDDVVEDTFGPGLPRIRQWTEQHFAFTGYIESFDPALEDRAGLRSALGYGDEPMCLVAVGGSGIGRSLLRRALEAVELARRRIPELHALVVTGPRIDPAELPSVPGVEIRGYVHELYRHALACDVAVVQGGLTTTMELVSAQRPFLAIPLDDHFEQNRHVRHRLDRYGARRWLRSSESSPERLATEIATMLEEPPPSYRRVERGGARRAAELIAPLVDERASPAR